MHAYSTALDHLDDVVSSVAHRFDGAELASSLERIEARLAANREADEPLPWDRMRAALRLSASEQAALLTLAAIELSPALRARMRELGGERIWPDVALLADFVYRERSERARMLDELAPDGALLRWRLVDVVGSARQVEDAPLMLRPLRVAPRVLEALHGTWRLDREVESFAELVDAPEHELLVPPAVVEEVTGLVRAGAAPAIVLCGREGAGRKALLARAAGGILRVRCADLPVDERELARALQAVLREARLFARLPVLDGVELLADRARVLDRVLARFPGTVAATAPSSDRPPLQLARGLVLVDVPVPDEPTREVLWQRALGDRATPETCAYVAERYAITGGTIARSAAAALARARAATSVEDVHAGVRATLDSKLGTLGTRVEVQQRWDDLVLPEETFDEIRELVARVQYRKQVHEHWGFAEKVGRAAGLSALFSGPPGTGKTMVAGLIARELGLDLYQIDLSRIVSKWIGETEKNLAQVFDAAEAGHAILLFDEADSLFAKRTEVKSSVDRYANLEVNYLLQRMDAFQGISILTTNLDASIDEAFRRRLSARVSFPLPELDERRALWCAHMPAKAAVARDVDVDTLAERYAMSGGYIRNATVRAAFLAAADASAIAMRHLARAASLEYAAMGKVMHA